MPKKATITTKSTKKTATSEKARPPRVMFDKKTGKYYVKIGKLKLPFPQDMPYEKAVQQSIKKIRATAPRKRKARRLEAEGSVRLEPLPGFSARSTKDSPLTINYAKMSAETQYKISADVQKKRKATRAGFNPEQLAMLADMELYQKKTAELKEDEARKEKDKLIKVEKALNVEKKVKEEKIDKEKKAESGFLKAKRYIMLKKLEERAKKGHPAKREEFQSIIDNLDRVTDEDLENINEIRIKEEKDAEEAERKGLPRPRGLWAWLPGGHGKGKVADQIDEVGLYSDQIVSCMQEYIKDGFIGVVAADELDELIKPSLQYDKFGFVMNKDSSDKPGSHWVAVYVDTVDDCSVEYYDSFAEDPDPLFLTQVKKLIDAHKLDIYLKFKINRIKEQAENSPLCGFHAMRFLIDRFKGKDFKDCSGYSNVRQSEKQAGSMMKKYDRFGYI